MKLAIPLLTAAAILITTSWSNATLQPLTDSEATDVLGGEIQGVCVPGPPGSECNQTDVYCSDGNPYCNEGNPDWAPCHYWQVFKKPTQCTADPNSPLECGTLQAQEVTCWSKVTCRCQSFFDIKFCFAPDFKTYVEHKIGKCQIVGG